LETDEDDEDDDMQDAPEEKSWRGSKAFKRYSKLCRSDADALFNFVS
jgi:hypothetical protein